MVVLRLEVFSSSWRICATLLMLKNGMQSTTMQVCRSMLKMWTNVITWTSLCLEGCARMQMLPVALFGLGMVMVSMATHSSSQRAAALCRAEVRTGNVEQLSQLGLSIDTPHIPFTTQHAVSQFAQQRKHLLANAARDLCNVAHICCSYNVKF